MGAYIIIFSEISKEYIKVVDFEDTAVANFAAKIIQESIIQRL